MTKKNLGSLIKESQHESAQEIEHLCNVCDWRKYGACKPQAFYTRRGKLAWQLL